MADTLAVFKDNKKMYSTSPLDPLLLDAVLGLDSIAKNVYDDEFVSFEMNGYSVSSFVGPKNIVVISFGKGKDVKTLRYVYEAYRICAAYDDMGLMDVLLNLPENVRSS